MGKVVKAVSPYIYKKGINFKNKPYDAWVKLLGNTKGVAPCYPPKIFHKLLYYSLIPCLHKNNEVRLCFVQASQLGFDTFPSYLFHEVIPFIWDCWPRFDENLILWLNRYNVKSCIFTSSEAANRIRRQIPNLNIMVVTEGIDVCNYPLGKKLIDRNIDLFLFGRNPSRLWKKGEFENISFKWGGSDDDFKGLLQNSKITLAFPRCDVEPEQTGGQETLTQRYWECMLSGMVMLGRAPKELIDLIGYNPVIDATRKMPVGDGISPLRKQISEILAHIEDYQELVDRNRETALRMAPWEIRMKQVMEWLEALGYEV